MLDFAPGCQLCLHSILVVFVSLAFLNSTARYVQSVYPRLSSGGSARGLCHTLGPLPHQVCERGSGGETVGTAAPFRLSVMKGWILINSKLNLCDKADPSEKTLPSLLKRFRWG